MKPIESLLCQIIILSITIFLLIALVFAPHLRMQRTFFRSRVIITNAALLISVFVLCVFTIGWLVVVKEFGFSDTELIVYFTIQHLELSVILFFFIVYPKSVLINSFTSMFKRNVFLEKQSWEINKSKKIQFFLVLALLWFIYLFYITAFYLLPKVLEILYP